MSMLRGTLVVLLFAITPRFVAAQALAARYAARELPRGTVLTVADISGDTANTSPIAGWVTRRVVKMGEPLREPAISSAPIVTNGERVVLRATIEGVTVSRPGTALADGAIGAAVRVRLSSQRTVSAIVTGPATVRIP
jgi:flagella basal body P-ring formation protein FlgA